MVSGVSVACGVGLRVGSVSLPATYKVYPDGGMRVPLPVLALMVGLSLCVCELGKGLCVGPLLRRAGCRSVGYARWPWAAACLSLREVCGCKGTAF